MLLRSEGDSRQRPHRRESPQGTGPWAATQRFWPYSVGLRRWIALALGLVALLPVIEAAEVWLFKILVDDVLVAGDLGALPLLLGLFVALNMASGGIGFAKDYALAFAHESFRLRLRTDVFAHVLRLTPLQLARRRTGDVLTRLSTDVTDIEMLVVSGPVTGVEAIVRIAAFAGMLFYLDWVLAIVSLTATPVLWLLARRFSSGIRAAAGEKRRRTGELMSHAEEVLTALPQVLVARAERSEIDRFERTGRRVKAAGLEATRLSATLRPLVDLLELTGALFVIGTGAWSVVSGRQSLGELLAFLTYLTQLYSPARSLTGLVSSASRAAAGADRVGEILDEEPAVCDPPSAVPVSEVRGAVSFAGVTVTYPGRTAPAVAGLDLEIVPGTVTAIVGPSGAGKSTIAALLLRLVDPDEGSVRLDGHDLRLYRLTDLRSAMGLLLQDTYLFDGTIADNVAYGSARQSRAAVLEALRSADARFVDTLPDGVDHQIGGKGKSLSGGQRRRVALARALLQAPPVLILDELSAGQDPATVHRILTAIRPLAHTTLLITHDAAVASCADRVVVLEHGVVVADGAPGVVVDTGRWIRSGVAR